MKERLLLIEWWDHSSFALRHWRDKSEIEELGLRSIISVGFVVCESKKSITLCATKNMDYPRYAGEICIMRSAIKRIRRL